MKLHGRSIALCSIALRQSAILFLVAAACSWAEAQNGCMTGDVSYMGVNGVIKICSQYDAKVPELQKQLAGMQQTLNGNQALMRELAHAARNINALGHDVDADRKAELLRSFGNQLQEIVSTDQAKTHDQLESLNQKLASLELLISEMRKDDKTAVQTKTALRGQLGEAIATLDLKNAQQQLNDIQTKLNSIDTSVKNTEKNTQEILETIKGQAKFAQVTLESWMAGIVWDFRVKAVPTGTHYDPKVRVLMMDIVGGNVRTVRKAVAADLIVTQFENQYRTQFNDLGSRVVVCYTAHAQGKPASQRLTLIFKILFNGKNPTFTLTQEPTIEPDSDAPCGGAEIAKTFREQADAGAKEEAMIKPVPASQHPANPPDAAGSHYDVRTGIMWTPTDAGKGMDYSQARQYCTDLKLAGHDDWHLPTFDELRALFDPIHPKPLTGHDAKDGTVGVRGEIQLGGSNVWTGTPGGTMHTVAGFAVTRKTFNFHSGGSFDADLTVYEKNQVLCMRGQPMYFPKPTETYTDPTTGLMWTTTDDEFYVEAGTAQAWCRNLKLGNFSDWRLPKIPELQALYDPAHSSIPLTRAATDPKVHVRAPIELSGYSAWSMTTEAHPKDPTMQLMAQSAGQPYNDYWYSNQSFNFQTGQADHATPGDARAICVRGKAPQ